jgi:hypothetical protein
LTLISSVGVPVSDVSSPAMPLDTLPDKKCDKNNKFNDMNREIICVRAFFTNKLISQPPLPCNGQKTSKLARQVNRRQTQGYR